MNRRWRGVAVKRAAGGMVLDGAKDVTVVGNLFSIVRPRALLVRGRPGEAVLFCDNVLVDAEADAGKLDKSLVDNNLGLSK